MSLQHHGPDEQSILRKRMLDQVLGCARREYPAGRMGGDDEGVLAFAIAADVRHRTVVIRFGKAVEWVGFGIDDVERLVETLQEKVRELRGVTV